MPNDDRLEPFDWSRNGAGRAVPLNQRALKSMQTWANDLPGRKPNHFVFPSKKIGISGNDEIPLAYDTEPTKAILSWKTSWTTARTAAGVCCRFHDIRHTCVTRLLEKGAAIATVAVVMGWSAGTAMRMAKRYGHIAKSAQREALALLDPVGVTVGLSAPAGAPATAVGPTVH